MWVGSNTKRAFHKMDFKYTLSQTLWLSFLLATTALNDVAMDLSMINIRGKLKEGIFF